MKSMKKRAIAATLAGGLLAISVAGGAVALASSDDGDGTVSGPEADRAVAAALAATGASKANAVERDTENGATWEVEVTKSDGSTVDVRLDGNLKVVVVEPDQEAPTGR